MFISLNTNVEVHFEPPTPLVLPIDKSPNVGHFTVAVLSSSLVPELPFVLDVLDLPLLGKHSPLPFSRRWMKMKHRSDIAFHGLENRRFILMVYTQFEDFQ